MAGEYLHKMNADALINLSVTFNEMGKSIERENLYLMTMATCNALRGSHNEMKNDPRLLDAGNYVFLSKLNSSQGILGGL